MSLHQKLHPIETLRSHYNVQQDVFVCVEEMVKLFLILLIVVPFSGKVIQIHFLIGVNLLSAVSNQQFIFPDKK